MNSNIDCIFINHCGMRLFPARTAVLNEGMTLSVNMKRLQSLIDKSVRAHNDAHSAGEALSEFCEKFYGMSRPYVFSDDIIDSCFGGCGQSNGMSAHEFDQIMKDSVRWEN